MLIHESKLLFTPSLYNGKITLFERDDSGLWQETGFISGYEKIKSAVKFDISTKSNSKKSNLSGTTKNGKFFHSEYQSVSFGLYQTDDQIVHLSLRFNENEYWNLHIEYFDTETLTLESHDEIINFSYGIKIMAYPVAYSKDGYIYVIENSETPFKRLRVIRN